MQDFPKRIKDIVGDLNYKKDEIGCSLDLVYSFMDTYILKVSENSEVLKDEYDKIKFLNEIHFPSPKAICYFMEDNKYYLFRECIHGDSLISDRFLNNPYLLIDVLADVFSYLKRLDSMNIPFKSKDNYGNEFVHGDLCLPNIYVDKDNNFLGFIDLDNSGLGDRWYDISWLIWSFEYNLKTDKYTNLLLNKLGISFNQEKYDLYIDLEHKEELYKRILP